MPSRCGAAVNAGQQNCDPGLYAPTGDAAMHCYAYGGPSDPCALNNNNDANDADTDLLSLATNNGRLASTLEWQDGRLTCN